MDLGLRDKSARKQDLRLRVDGADAEESLVSSLFGHDHIEQDEVDLRRIRLINLNRVETVLGEQHRVAELLERFDQEVPDRFVIVDDEDRLAPSRQ